MSDTIMIKKYLLLSVVIITCLVFYKTYSIDTSINNKAQLSDIQKIYFPTLEKIDTAIVDINNIKDLFVRFVTMGDDSALTEINNIQKELNGSLLEINGIQSKYQKETNEIISELNQYIKLGISASSILQEHQLNPPKNKEYLILEIKIYDMNSKLKSLNNRINTFRSNIYKNFIATLNNANSTANQVVNFEIFETAFILLIVIFIVYFSHQNISLPALRKAYSL